MHWASTRGFLTRPRNCASRARPRHTTRHPMNETNIVAAVLRKVRAANAALIDEGALPAGIDQSRIAVEPPREAAHGELATNAAMVLAKDARRKPRELAGLIAERLEGDAFIARAEI